MKEVFKEISGYENLYEISNLGNVRNCVTGRILVPQERRDGYLQVNLYKNREMKSYLVHRLVARAFIKNPAKLPQINHIDENKKNNVVTNLEWVTAKENLNYGTRNERIAKAHSKKVICVETGLVYSSALETEKQTGIYHSNISACCLGKLYTAGKYHWKYLE